MNANESTARIKINRLLEEAGWRFFDDNRGKANIRLEVGVKISGAELDNLGDDFESAESPRRGERGYVDFLLLDEKGFPLIVLEAKSEKKGPLVGKEQAREYAESQKCRFVILSNGNLHYFWDLNCGNPHPITTFPSPESVVGYTNSKPDPEKLIGMTVEKDYIVKTQFPDYAQQAGWKNDDERAQFITDNNLRFLRDYQQQAVRAIQQGVRDGKERFLFEMATGTGKTLTAAAVIKLFLSSGNARRVLFLVDRLELEEQARKSFVAMLRNDYQTVVYKQNRDDWRRAEIVVTTVQSLLYNNKYRQLFSPTDFNLVISDEAHRSIGGNARAAFEYFIGYKLGLTATPKDYIKGGGDRDPRDYERRLLLDTYRTFGCENAQPTFRYSLIDAVNDGYLINPIVVDARSRITTQLLSDEGYSVMMASGEDDAYERTFEKRDYEKKFFSQPTNETFCRTFLQNALRDPISGEIGKSIVFAVSQRHAERLTEILNTQADSLFPGKYRSDFAVQVTSHVEDAQQYAINFANNNLLGNGNFLPSYKTSKARVCVTVGMMTTGYDCPDLLNLALMRPIFSPTDFIQIKGRGTRRHEFSKLLSDGDMKRDIGKREKERYKLFDFFANCEYFEEKFNYDEVIALPLINDGGGGGGGDNPPAGEHENFDHDPLRKASEYEINFPGMKIDRMYYDQFENKIKESTAIKELVESGEWEKAEQHVADHLINKPEEYFTLEKLRRGLNLDRWLGLREILEKAFGYISAFKSKDDLLEEEFNNFVNDHKPDDEGIMQVKYFFKAYVTDKKTREIIDSGEYPRLSVSPIFSLIHYLAVPEKWREIIPQYIKDYVKVEKYEEPPDA